MVSPPHDSGAAGKAPDSTIQQLESCCGVWQQLASKGIVEQLLLGRLSGELDVEAQDLLLDAVASPITRSLPPNVQFLQRLAKAAIQAAEAGGCQLGERLLQLQTALLFSASSAVAVAQAESCWRYKTFYYSSQPSWQQLLLLQDRQLQAVSHASSPGSALLPQAQLQELHQRQQLMAELAAAAGSSCQQQREQGALPQLPPQPAAIGSEAGPPRQQQCRQPAPGGTEARCCSCDCGSCYTSRAGLLSLHVSDNLFEGGTGCHMWHASFLLAEFVLSHPELFRGRRCLEVGCGPGLVASCLCRVMAGSASPGQLLLTDGDHQTLDNCLANLALNGHVGAELLGSWQEAVEKQQQQENQLQVLACPLVWDDDVPGLAADVVLGSDCCYDPAAVPSLVRLLQQLLCGGQKNKKNGGAVAYLATTRRQPATLQLLEEQAAAAGLMLQEVALAGGADGSPGWGVRFQQLPALDDRQQRFVLHRVVAAGAAAV